MTGNNGTTEMGRMLGLFALLLEGRVPVIEALDAISRESPDADLCRVLADVSGGVREGSSLAEELARFPDLFPNPVVEVIRAGEASGLLDANARRAADILRATSDESPGLPTGSGSPALYCLSRMLAGGVGWVPAMRSLDESTGDQDSRDAVENSVRRLEEGESLQSVAEAVPQILPPPIPTLFGVTEQSGAPVDQLIESLVEGQEAGCLSLPPFPGETLAIAIRNAFFLAALGLVSGMSLPAVLAELESCVARDELRDHFGEMRNNAETGAQGIVSDVMRNHQDVYPESMTLVMEMAEWRNYDVGFRKIAEGLARGYFRLAHND